MEKPTKRPILKLIEDTAEKLDNLIGLNDNQAVALRHLISTTFGIKNIHLNFNCHSNPKTIIILAFSPEGKKLYIKPKYPEVLNKMLDFLQIRGFTIRFDERKDV
ncbi:MAG: hypothetical protein QXL01_01570 [Thermoplasmatales archaeon]